MNVKYAFIASEEGNYPIVKMCDWAKVSRSGFYDWWSREPSARAARRAPGASPASFRPRWPGRAAPSPEMRWRG